MDIARITVLGAGTMGHGIAHAAIAGGFHTRMYDVNDAAIQKGAKAIEGVISKGVELGKVTSADADAMRARLKTTSNLGEALAETDFVIEAAPERIDLKLSLM